MIFQNFSFYFIFIILLCCCKHLFKFLILVNNEANIITGHVGLYLRIPLFLLKMKQFLQSPIIFYGIPYLQCFPLNNIMPFRYFLRTRMRIYQRFIVHGQFLHKIPQWNHFKTRSTLIYFSHLVPLLNTLFNKTLEWDFSWIGSQMQFILLDP